VTASVVDDGAQAGGADEWDDRPGDPLEREGMSRTEKSLELGDLLLHIVDRNAPKPADFAERPNEQTELLLLNKSDLPEHADWSDSDGLRISCMTEEGLGGLEEKIIERISRQNLHSQSAIAINTRHRDCLRRARPLRAHRGVP